MIHARREPFIETTEGVGRKVVSAERIVAEANGAATRYTPRSDAGGMSFAGAGRDAATL
jgi:hypothetical protein